MVLPVIMLNMLKASKQEMRDKIWQNKRFPLFPKLFGVGFVKIELKKDIKIYRWKFMVILVSIHRTRWGCSRVPSNTLQ